MLYWKRSRAGRRQLDRQRETVKASANFGDGNDDIVGQLKSRTHRLCTRQKQLHGVLGCQRWYRPDGFTTHPKPFAAGGKDAQTRASLQKVFGDFSSRGDHVLAVVEHDQQTAFTDHRSQLSRVRQVESKRDRRAHTVGIAERGKLHQTRTVSQVSRLGSGHLNRQPRFAHPSWSHERQEAAINEQQLEVAQLLVASHQWGQ